MTKAKGVMYWKVSMMRGARQGMIKTSEGLRLVAKERTGICHRGRHFTSKVLHFNRSYLLYELSSKKQKNNYNQV